MRFCTVLITAVLAIAFMGTAFAADSVKIETDKDKVSYTIGYDIGTNFKTQKIDVDSAVLLRGIQDAMADGDALMSDEDRKNTMVKFQTEMREKMESERKAAGGKNQADGEKFLAENKGKPGVVTTESGLQYMIITEGNGPKPSDADTVKTHYKGTLIDGTEFDSSYTRGQPASFPVKGVIAGWTEALQLMPTGSKWELYIPANLAYGDRGAGQSIGPNATLIFEIELLEIVQQ